MSARSASLIFALLALLASGPAGVAPSRGAPPPEPADDAAAWRVELALFPWVTVQQVEGPVRDDLLTRELGLASQISATWAPWPWLEAGLHLQVDAGSSRRALFGRPDEDGVAAEAQAVEGSFWELWAALLLRGSYGPVFAEVGWAPLILREDTTRTDLPNQRGETDGIFVGSRTVAWLLGAGGRIGLTDELDLTLRVQFRIRYLVERGGAPLADGEENGQMTVWPFIGLSWMP